MELRAEVRNHNAIFFPSLNVFNGKSSPYGSNDAIKITIIGHIQNLIWGLLQTKGFYAAGMPIQKNIYSLGFYNQRSM